MGEILNFIEKKGEGKYHFYKTKKISIDTTDSEVLDYDDKPVSATKTSKIAETDTTLKHTILISKRLIENSRPIFTFFLDGSRHVYKIDDMAIGKKNLSYFGGSNNCGLL